MIDQARGAWCRVGVLTLKPPAMIEWKPNELAGRLDNKLVPGEKLQHFQPDSSASLSFIDGARFSLFGHTRKQ